jgi:AmmeMemoRadiSam system protein B
MELFKRCIMREISAVRPSPIAGSWYPGNRDALQSEIKSYLEQATPCELLEKIYGLISPHAGYFYSGATAGYAYRCVQGKCFDICAVFSPLHDYQPFELLTTGHSAYATPLGEIPVAADLVNEIDEQLGVNSDLYLQRIANDREHSLEIQLPFLQVVLKGPFELLPVMVRTHDPEKLHVAASVIAKSLGDKRVLVVASTDLSHFYPERTANTYDKVMTTHFAEFDPEGVLRAESKEEGFACGAGAVALALWTTRLLGANKVTLLHHTTSAESSGDASSVVGYAAAAITG